MAAKLPALDLDPARERDDLERYLGDRFELDRLQRYQGQLDEEYSRCGDEQAFYRSSHGYLYNLTAFAMTGTKLPYLRELVRLVPPPARVLDYGCGIGSDGLLLLAAGYQVEFADFDNPSTEYLRWRLARRGVEAPIHDLDRAVPQGFDAAYAFDVIEHVDDPFAFLVEMERRADLVLVNLLEPKPEEEEQQIHHELPIDELLHRAAARRLRSYRIHHGSSHLVAYSPGSPSPVEALAARIRLLCGRARRRATTIAGRR
ncbi:MAG: class I SAM-dependent methyltransferase [Solirubrobacterales bacterium]